VRLKNGEQALSLKAAGRGKRCGDLRRMMRVIVDNKDVIDLAFLLEPPLDAAKTSQGAANDVNIDPERKRDARRGKSGPSSFAPRWQMKLVEKASCLRSVAKMSHALENP
jgi:hypothetical protein